MRSLGDLKDVDLKDAFTFFFFTAVSESTKRPEAFFCGAVVLQNDAFRLSEMLFARRKKRTLGCIEGNVASFLSPRFLLEKQSEP